MAKAISKVQKIAFERWYDKAVVMPKEEFVELFVQGERNAAKQIENPSAMERNIAAGQFDEVLRDSGYLWHKRMVKHALETGNVVPMKVLADYPDLKVKPPSSEAIWQLTASEYLKSQMRYDVPKTKDWRATVKRTVQWHEGVVRQAHVEGKPVPAKVLKDYPDLKVKVKAPVELPTGAKQLTFKDKQYACYGKQTKRGYRAYCRRV